MSLVWWIILFLIQSLFYKWLLSWGGAQWLVGLKSALTFGWMTWDWNAEQIRLYALLLWIISSIWFVVGVFQPSLRL
ncbi:MAG: hypothetical protein H9855_00160 [Candidatus Acinetobacter avistercoris]|uniref:hypothetical protein n=1 Tax=Acinetobacter sp. KS-LM10 TaxID=3120518 RepID=UPI001FA0A88B|nr:hypothetical protein [Candidatus Acinetobacter avistercoris]